MSEALSSAFVYRPASPEHKEQKDSPSDGLEASSPVSSGSGILRSFEDLFTCELIRDPVVDKCGHVFEKFQIMNYIGDQDYRICPYKQKPSKGPADKDDPPIPEADRIRIEDLRPVLPLKQFLDGCRKYGIGDTSADEDRVFVSAAEYRSLRHENAELRQSNAKLEQSLKMVFDKLETLSDAVEGLKAENAELRAGIAPRIQNAALRQDPPLQAPQPGQQPKRSRGACASCNHIPVDRCDEIFTNIHRHFHTSLSRIKFIL